MKTTLSILLACLLAHGGPSMKSKQSGTAQDIDKVAASKIAQEHAARTYGSLDRYDIVLCEEEILWRVFFDPNSAAADGSGLEYTIGKRGGRVISQRKLLLAAPNARGASAASEINRTQAIASAKKDGVKAYGSLANYRLTTCELNKAWVVIYSPALGLDGGGPEYVIDKRGGRILDKKYYQ